MITVILAGSSIRKAIRSSFGSQKTKPTVGRPEKNHHIFSILFSNGDRFPLHLDGVVVHTIAVRYGVKAYPRYVLISPEGIILDAWSGYARAELTKSICHYLEGY